ncbi:hypothetical protein EYF80_037204 [Liparis tanakae]|uniref:Uncharacterized protein n=1 Tax=Liparis tanakae TaxID=230148 RepID=A0A4Z2GGM3_9TELE|nr:hypothetical protein EYF80_037204 [Liparis tanakae]
MKKRHSAPVRMVNRDCVLTSADHLAGVRRQTGALAEQTGEGEGEAHVSKAKGEKRIFNKS